MDELFTTSSVTPLRGVAVTLLSAVLALGAGVYTTVQGGGAQTPELVAALDMPR